MKTIQEQLASLRAAREAKAARMTEIVNKAIEEDRTKGQEEQEEFDAAREEIEAIDREIKDLEGLVSMQVAKATVVDAKKAGTSTKGAAEARDFCTVKTAPKVEPGTRFASYVMAMVQAKGDPDRAFRIASNSFVKEDDSVMSVLKAQRDSGMSVVEILQQKANVNGGTTQDSTWAAPLVQYQDFAGDFVEFLRPQTIVGKFGQGNVPSLNRVPFNVRIPQQTTGGSAQWVGEGKPKPLTKFDFSTATLQWTKIAAIAVITQELARFSSPSASVLVRDSLRDAVIARMDSDFIDPTKAAVANVSPASITNAATPISSTGADAASIRRDIRALWAPFIAANNPPTSAVYIMTATTALALSLMQNDLGQLVFPGLSINGGTLGGIPVIVSEYLDNSAGSAGGIVVLVNARDIWLADDGEVTVDTSTEASLQMDDAPTDASDTGTEAQMVSMFQTNSIAIRAERYIHWKLRRSSAVSYVDAAQWGQGAV